MDRQALRETLLNLLEQETWERPENFADDLNLRTGLKLDSVDLLSVALHAERKLGISIGSQADCGIFGVCEATTLACLPATAAVSRSASARSPRAKTCVSPTTRRCSSTRT